MSIRDEFPPLDRPLKVRDVIYQKAHEGNWITFGRVEAIYPDGTVMIVDGGRFRKRLNASDLVIVNYRGFHNGKRFVPMTSLRKLKQRASRYYPSLWKHRRRSGKFMYADAILGDLVTAP